MKKNHNKWTYGLGTVGRDMVYTMISMYLMFYLIHILHYIVNICHLIDYIIYNCLYNHHILFVHHLNMLMVDMLHN